MYKWQSKLVLQRRDVTDLVLDLMTSSELVTVGVTYTVRVGPKPGKALSPGWSTRDQPERPQPRKRRAWSCFFRITQLSLTDQDGLLQCLCVFWQHECVKMDACRRRAGTNSSEGVVTLEHDGWE